MMVFRITKFPLLTVTVDI